MKPLPNGQFDLESGSDRRLKTEIPAKTVTVGAARKKRGADRRNLLSQEPAPLCHSFTRTPPACVGRRCSAAVVDADRTVDVERAVQPEFLAELADARSTSCPSRRIQVLVSSWRIPPSLPHNARIDGRVCSIRYFSLATH